MKRFSFFTIFIVFVGVVSACGVKGPPTPAYSTKAAFDPLTSDPVHSDSDSSSAATGQTPGKK